MKNILTAFLISATSIATLAMSPLAYASDTDTTEDHSHSTEGDDQNSMQQTDSELPIVTGEVKKVKPKSGKITIKHDEIPNLDMPGMTMVFRVGEETDISQFKKGDKVTFTVIEKDGKMTIMAIENAE